MTHPPASRTLATKLGRPFRVPAQVVPAHGRPGRLDGLDEVLDHQRRLEELFRVDLGPCHFHGAGIAGRTRREFLLAVDRDLCE